MSDLNEVKKLAEEHIKCLEEDNLDEIARESSFVQRSTNKVSGRDFLELMTIDHFGQITISLEGLCDVLREKSSRADISPQALSEKINSKYAVAFLEKILERIYKNQLRPKLEKIPLEVFKLFPNVYLQDSTQIELNEHLSEEFSGVGGSASKSALKIDLLYETINHILKEVTITEGTYADQKNGANVMGHIQERDLIIRDLGYFDLSVLESIEDKKAYYLSRLFKSVKIYLSSESQAEAIDPAAYVRKRIGNIGFMDMKVYLGAERVGCRLVSYRVPEQIINERRRKARRSAQKKGRIVTREYLEWLDYSFYITNVGVETWPPEIVGTIYRIRWQIELIFKQWKQLFQINVMQGTRSERIRCVLYGRLIMINIVTQIYALSTWYCSGALGREVSEVKLIKWLQRKGRICQTIVKNQVSTLMEELINSLPKGLLKQKRRRKTTFGLIDEQIGFLESFS